MGIKESWKGLMAWWGANAKSNERKLSAGFSWMIVIIISALTVPLIAILQGDVPNWAAFFVVVITTVSGFLIMLVESIFGKREAPVAAVAVIPPIEAAEEIAEELVEEIEDAVEEVVEEEIVELIEENPGQ